MITAICGILIFCMLIFPHELGHFMAAKACGIKVNEFAFGMGPAIFKRKKGETQYSLRLLPIGGYCAMEGEDESSDDERAFDNKPAWQKFIVLIAGSFMNLMIALIIVICLTFYSGVATTTVGDVVDGGPAQEAGIRSGDVLVSVDGKAIDEWTDLSAYISETKKKNADIGIERNGKKMIFKTGLEDSEGRTIIGVTSQPSHNFFSCLGGGVKNTWQMIITLFDSLKQIFTGQMGMKELGGPVAIVKVAGDAGKAGAASFLYLAAFISINLGVFNMLPLPALDGGRVVFLVIRLITGKRVTSEMEGKVHLVGLFLLFALMIYVTCNDVTRIFQ